MTGLRPRLATIGGARLDLVAGLALIVTSLLIRLPTLAQPLVEAHGFRQTQTAYPALLFHLNGIDLLHSQLPVLGPPWEVPFEFPLFQALASLPMDAGLPVDLSLRLTALATFVLSAVILWALVARFAGRLAGLLALGAFLFSPFAMLWSRAALDEYLALAASLGFVWFALDGRANGGLRPYVAALALGSVAMVVKAPTGGIWLLPFLIIGPDWSRLRAGVALSRIPWRSIAFSWTLVAIPGIVGLAWTRYADSIKAAVPATQWLTSGQLLTWTFGTAADRFTPGAWSSILEHIGMRLDAIGTFVPLKVVLVLVPLGAWFAWRRGGFGLFAWFALAVVSGPVIFLNLYRIHDYYSAAISAGVAGLLGIGAASLAVRAVPRPIVAAAGLGLAGLWIAGLMAQQSYWGIAYLPVADPSHDLPPARQIAAETSPDQLVAIMGRDWTPAILYYARRRGYMISGHESMPDLLPKLRAQGYVIYTCPTAPQDPPCTRLP